MYIPYAQRKPKETPTSGYIPYSQRKPVETPKPLEQPISLSNPFGTTSQTTPSYLEKSPLTLEDIKTGAKIAGTVVKTLGKGIVTGEGVKEFREGFIEGTPEALAGTERGLSVLTKKIGEGTRFLIEKINLPGQLTEFVTQGGIKVPEVEPILFNKISQKLAQSSDKNSEISKNLLNNGIEIKDARTFKEKLQSGDIRFLFRDLMGKNAPNLALTFGVSTPVAILSGGAGLPILATAFTTSGLLEGGSSYNEAKYFLENSDNLELKKLAQDTKFLESVAIPVGIINGLLDSLLPTEILTKGVTGNLIRKSVINKVMTKLLSLGISAGTEAPTEGLQEIVTNAVAQTYDKNRSLFANVPEASLGGFLLGGGAGVTTEIVETGAEAIKKSAELYSQMTPAERQAGFAKLPFKQTKEDIKKAKETEKQFEESESDRIINTLESVKGNTKVLKPEMYGEVEDFFNSIEKTKGTLTFEQRQTGNELIRLLGLDKKEAVKPTDEESSLQDPSKYKTAEEFVKAQGTPVYRGSGTNKTGMIGSDLGSGKYYAENLSVAKEYGSNIESTTLKNLNIKNIANSEYENLVQKEYLKIRDAHPKWDGSRNSAIKIRTEAKDIINQQFVKQGYDGISSVVAGEKIYNVFPDSVNKIQTHSQLTDIWNKANEKKAYKFTGMEKYFNMPVEEAKQALGKLFNEEEVDFFTTDVFLRAGRAGERGLAYGTYTNALISAVEQKGKVIDIVVFHEAFHAYLDLFVSKERAEELRSLIKDYFNLKDNYTAEEKMADLFADYAKTKRTFSEKLNAFFDSIIKQIRKWIGNESQVIQLFDDIIAKKRPEQRQAPSGETKFKEVEPLHYTEIIKQKKKLLNEYLNGDKGVELQLEIEQRIQKLSEKKPNIIQGIKNNPSYIKEKTLPDLAGEGWLVKKGDRYVVAESNKVVKYDMLRYERIMGIDKLAQEAGFEGIDAGQRFLEYQLELSKLSKATNFKRLAEKKLMEDNELFNSIVGELEKIKEDTTPEERQMILEKGKRLFIIKRRQKVRAIRDFFALSDSDLNKINRKDIRFMGEAEFENFLSEMEVKATQFREKLQAKAELMDLIHHKDLRNIENYRNALKLPAYRDMTTEQFRQFAETLEPFQTGDSFLTQREIETVDKTDLKGIRTWREAKEKLAKETGKPISKFDNIKVSELHEFLWDTALADQNPFYEMMVDTTNKALFEAERKYLETEKEAMRLAKLSNTSRKIGLVGKIIPQDEQIMDYLEALPKDKKDFAMKMTPEQIDYAHFIQQNFAQALTYLIQTKALARGRENYFTHIRRGVLEDVKESGLIQAFKNVFKHYKEDEVVFNILDEDTGNILPLEKFFQFALKRTGELEPTKNVSKAFLTYMKTLYKKQALDSLIPKLDIYVQSLTPKRYTPRGLEMDRSLKTFVNKWINNKKGRRIRWVAKQGGKVDMGIRALRMFTSLADLGLNIGASVATIIGEQMMTVQGLGFKDYTKGQTRLLTSKGRKIVEQYKNFVGKSAWEEITEADKPIGDRLMDGIFFMFRQSTVSANKTFLLGSMTDAEWNSGKISTERLAELRRSLGRYRDVKGAQSIVGSTTAGGATTQYKRWAIPILGRTFKNIKDISLELKSGNKKALTSKQAQELYRAIELTAFVMIIGMYVMSEDDDDSFLGKLKKKAYREAMTFLGGVDPKLFLSVPRVLTFLESFGNNLQSLLKMEEYKTKGGLKGIGGFQRQFTPAFIRQFQGKEESKTEKGGLPKKRNANSGGLPKKR